MTMFRINGADGGAIARGFDSLASAFFPDPAREAQALYYASGSRHNSARAADQEIATRGRQDMAAGIRSGAPSADVHAGAVLAGHEVMRATPEFYLSHVANAPGASPRAPAVVNAQMGARVPYQNTAPGVDEGNANAIQRAHISAGPAHAAVAAQRDQWNRTPVTMMGPGSQPIIVPRQDVAAGRLPPGAVPLVTQDQVQGNVAARLAQGQDVPNVPLVLAPGQVVANQGQMARDAAQPVMVVGPGGMRTVARGEMQPGDVIVPNNEPREAAQTAALAGVPLPTANVAAAQAAGAVLPSGRAGAQPRTVGALDRQRMEEEIRRQMLAVYGAADVDPGLLSRLAAQATAAYQATGDSGAAIEEVMRPIRLRPPGYEVSGGWWPWSSGRVQERAQARGAPASTPPLVGAAGGAAAVPPGLVPIGRAPDGRTVYRDGEGRTFAR